MFSGRVLETAALDILLFYVISAIVQKKKLEHGQKKLHQEFAS